MSTATIPAPTTTDSPAHRLRRTAAAVRVSIRWFGVRKTLTNEQKSQAAEPFGAEGDFLSARKKLLDTNHPSYKTVTAVRGKVLAFWRACSLPYPEPGVRLIKQDQIEPFNQQMLEYRDELNQAVADLDEHYSELKAAARHRLGQLFNASDYPPSLDGLFGVEWDFPSLQPPDYLNQLNPEIYEQEKARIAARFEEAVRLAEEAFIGELARLVSHLTERLSNDAHGERKVFRDSVVTNLGEFFNRFGELNIRSNPQLEDLVNQAQQIVQGVEPGDLRSNEQLRQHVTSQFSRVQATLDGMMVDRPRRNIIRRQQGG